MARKLMDRKDILENLVDVILPKYFPDPTLNKSRTGIAGYLTETQAIAIEDTITLEQRRATDYCPELSDSEIHVKQTAKIRSIEVDYAHPGKAFAMLGILKEDILNKGTRVNINETDFTIDRRSIIMHNGIPFSLEDDIVIRAVMRPSGYVYAASYSGEYSTYESYIQMYEEINAYDQEMVILIVQIYQFSYNIQEKIVTDNVQFLYDGISYDYENLLAGFDVYYKNSASDPYKKLEKKHYLTNETTNAIYYNDDDSNILFILNNPKLNIGINAMIKVEIRETLGTDGMVTIGQGNTTLSLYRDGAYNYSGVNITISMISDTVDASNGDTLEDVKHRLIDAKTRRNNITTEHDIKTYINDYDANIQIIKKRNDIEDRRYYMYTLLRHNKEIVPAHTKRAYVKGIINIEDIGDFDHWDMTVDRKLLRAYNKWKLVENPDKTDEDYVVKIPRNPVTDEFEEEETEDDFYYTCPFMILLNKYNIANYYFTSVNDSVLINNKPTKSIFPFQMITRDVKIYRDSHDPESYDWYNVSVTGNLNTSTDADVVNPDGSIDDPTKIMCYIIWRCDDSPIAYLPMEITGYNKETREFTFSNKFQTSDYITEEDRLETTLGMFRNGTNTKFNSVIDFKDGYFEVYFMYKYTGEVVYTTDDTKDLIHMYLPKSRLEGYELMNGYYNTPIHPYNLVLEFNKISSSPVKCVPVSETNVDYSIGEIPLIKYDYGIEHTIDLYDTFENFKEVYGGLLKLTTDFDVSLKFIGTYGHSRWITVTGGRAQDGTEVIADLNDLNPTFYFKVHGKNVDIPTIRQYIYEYLRDTYITGATVFMSNICTLVEDNFSAVTSIKYMGVNKFDASFQEFNYNMPEFDSVDVITKFVPEQLNVTDIQIELVEY